MANKKIVTVSRLVRCGRCGTSKGQLIKYGDGYVCAECARIGKVKRVK